MPSTLRPLAVDQLGVVAVIGLVLVEHVAERVPMGGALHAQHQRVVGIADAVPVLPAGDGVGAGRQHLVDRIEAAAEQAVLRAVGVERNAERKHLAGADQARRLDDVLRRDLVERSDVIVFAPAAPVLELFRRLGDRLLADLDVHRSTPSSPGVYSRGGQRAAGGCAPVWHKYFAACAENRRLRNLLAASPVPITLPRGANPGVTT